MKISDVYNNLRAGKSLSTQDYYELASTGLPLTEIPKEHMDELGRTGKIGLIIYAHPEMLTPEIVPLLRKDDLEFILSRHSRLIRMIPKNHLSFNCCLVACRKEPELLSEVPKTIQVYSFFEKLIFEKWLLKYVPKEKIDRELCLLAVSRNPKNLQYVPDEFLDYELCIKAVENFGSALAYVPKELQDRDMILRITNEKNRAFPHIRENLLTPEFIRELAGDEPELIACFPVSAVPEGMVLSAVMEDAHIFEELPEEMKTFKVCEYILNERSFCVGSSYTPLYYQIPEHVFRELVFSLPGVSDAMKEILYQNFLKRNQKEEEDFS